MYMWGYRNRPLHDMHRIVLSDWQASRRANHPHDFLKAFSGTVSPEGYQVYHKLENKRNDLKIGSCWNHARIPYVDIIKSIVLLAAKGSVTQEAYYMITEMLHINNEFDDLPTSNRLK